MAAAALTRQGADMATAQLRRHDGALVLVAERGFTAPFLDYFAVVDDRTTPCGAAALAGQPVEVVDVATDPIFDEEARQALLLAGSHACISAPVMSGAASIGVISAHYRERGRHDVEAVDAIATVVAAMLVRSARPPIAVLPVEAWTIGEPDDAEVIDGWVELHWARRRAAINRTVARHEQAAVLHEIAATLFDQHDQPARADEARHRAEHHAIAAGGDRDLLDAMPSSD